MFFSNLPGSAENAKQDFITKKYGFTLEEEQEIGFQSTLTMVKKYGLYKNPVINQYISNVGETIARKISKRPAIKYRFILLNTSEVNAFAAPGGFIMVTKGAISMLDNEAELVGLLSHEITHVEEGHGLQALAADPKVKEKLRTLRVILDAGKGLSQRNLDNLDKDLKKNRKMTNTINFDSIIECDILKDGKLF